MLKDMEKFPYLFSFFVKYSCETKNNINYYYVTVKGKGGYSKGIKVCIGQAQVNSKDVSLSVNSNTYKNI